MYAFSGLWSFLFGYSVNAFSIYSFLWIRSTKPARSSHGLNTKRPDELKTTTWIPNFSETRPGVAIRKQLGNRLYLMLYTMLNSCQVWLEFTHPKLAFTIRVSYGKSVTTSFSSNLYYWDEEATVENAHQAKTCKQLAVNVVAVIVNCLGNEPRIGTLIGR